MLNITAQQNSEEAKKYFAGSDYYASVDEQEIVGEWGGRAAAMLGLTGKVDKPSFDRLCDNEHPETGKPLTRITREGRRVGYDFTWSAPKSVSVLQALTGDEKIMAAWRQSVRETMNEMEADMQVRVRKDGQESDRTSGNWVWAEFVHLTSRPVNKVPCPQLHSHCFAQNLSMDLVEKQWKAGQFGGIKSYGYYWQAVQQARFAHKLEELGFATRPTKDAFEIVGVPDSVIKTFSKRTGVIEKVAAMLGITDPKRKAGLAATTREKKNAAIPYRELIEIWNDWLTDGERTALLDVSDRARPRTALVENQRHAEFSIEHTFERSSIAEKRRVLTLALKHGVGRVTPDGVRQQVDDYGLLSRDLDGRTWVTTKSVLASERRMLAFATSGKGACRPIVAGRPKLADERLDADQRRAVEHVISSRDRVMLIVGKAGTGKTTLAKEAVRQIESQGKPVVMLAPSAQASRGVLRDQEGFKDADTLARFMLDENMQESARDGVIWLDEAGLVSTRNMSRLFDLAGKINARIVAVGDHEQMASVGAGAAFRALQEIAKLPVARVAAIKRQTVAEYRDVVKLLSKGKTADGFDRLNDLGWIKLLPAWDQYKPVADAYISHVERNRDSLIVCPTHKESALVVAEVRKQLKARHLLEDDERTIRRLVPLQWTEAERLDAGRYTGEEIIRFNRNVGGFRAGEQVRAGDVLDRISEIKPKYFTTFAAEEIAIAPGEVIRIGLNCKSLDGHQLNNGACYRVKRFSRGGDLVLENGWVLGANSGAAGYGYTSTAHASQGRTTDHLILVQSTMSHAAASREAFYVALTRGRKSAEVFTDDRRALRDAVLRTDPRITATELMQVPTTTLWQRMRKKIERVEQAAWWAVRSVTSQPDRNIARKELQYER